MKSIMKITRPQVRWFLVLIFCGFFLSSAGCGGQASETATSAAEDPQLKKLGTVEVTARLVEIPDGAIFERDLYHYAGILRYEIVAVQRGKLNPGETIYVGHYDPWKPRSEAADKQVTNVGGHLQHFEPGQLHHMALEVPMDDFYLGAIVDKYFGKHTGPVYWAVWTDPAD
jgi:hypothetical protein